MTARLIKTLKTDKIQSVRSRPPICVGKETLLSQVIGLMQDKKRGSAVVVEKEKLAGIFTERDLLTRVLSKGLNLKKTAIGEVMTRSPDCLRNDSSIAEAISLMSGKQHRHLPIVSADGAVAGMVSVRDIVDYLAEHFPYEVYNLPPDPHQISTAPEGA
ncbi:MAG: CBS domain-containing protein [Deltaproteobacteria bacterium]|nr:CBS domain-containing protein [Deltaproteobacteria bacterium]